MYLTGDVSPLGCDSNYHVFRVQELKGMSLPKVVLTSQPAAEGAASPREQLSNHIARISQLQRKTSQVRFEFVQLRDHVTSWVYNNHLCALFNHCIVLHWAV